MSVEKREFLRVPCSSRVRCSHGKDRHNFGQVLDISRTGARLVFDGSAPTQMVLEFGDKFSVPAQTVWKQNLGTGRQMAGVRFEEMQLAQKCSLSEYMAVQMHAEVSRILAGNRLKKDPHS